MTPDVVVDIGNTRIKWGLLLPDEPVIERLVALPPDPLAWEQARGELPPRQLRWAIASVQPARADRLIEFLRGRGEEVVLLTHADVRVTANVEQPHRVGLDRLLNALAARHALAPEEPAILIDAGSAVTVDYLDEQHVFQGGTIFPGLELMARALHDYTAQLPLVEVAPPLPPLPGKSTVPAMQLGILHAVSGGIASVCEHLTRLASSPPRVFWTGGQAANITQAGGWHSVDLWPEMTLMGVLFAAQGR